MSFELITSERRLGEVIAEHAGEQFVAVDTEFRRRDTFYPQVALVQLCWRETAYLIDPTTFFDFSGLRDLLVNEGVIKLLHSPSEDLGKSLIIGWAFCQRHCLIPSVPWHFLAMALVLATVPWLHSLLALKYQRKKPLQIG